MDVNRICISCMGDRGNSDVCPFCGSKQDLIPSPQHSLPPQTILMGKYLVGRVLGFGGFGITYISWDLEKGKKTAIKEYLPDGLATRVSGMTEVSVYTEEKADNFTYGLEKFMEEARTIYKFKSHPNIISVNDLFEENGTAYYSMEYMDGIDLRQYVEKYGGKLSFNDAMSLMLPVFDALKEVHGYGYIHRDISPDNICISPNKEVKLIDFGAARHAVGERSQNLSVILKMGYAPEEQYRSRGQQGPWTDVYAVGATIYKLITGQLPPESTERVIEDTIQRPSELGVIIPPYAEAALMKAMAVRSKDRFQNMSEFKNAIAGKAASTPQSAVPGGVKIDRTINQQPSNPASVKRYETGVQYAGFWKRFAASFLDGILILIGFYIIVRLLPLPYVSLYVINMLLGWLYYSLFESSDKQATPGKMALGIKVTDLNGRRISFGRATGRYFGKYLSCMILCIGYMMSGFTEKKQALHDIIAETLVVTVEPVLAGQMENNSGRLTDNLSGSETNPYINYSPLAEPGMLTACLYGISGYFAGGHFPIGSDEVVLGRDYSRCQIVFPIDEPGISAVHCSVAYHSGENMFVLKDLGSSCGTFLASAKRLNPYENVLLHPGEQFFLGNSSTMFEVNIKS